MTLEALAIQVATQLGLQAAGSAVPVLKRAIERLGALGVFNKATGEFDPAKLANATPDEIIQLLKDLLSTPGQPDPVVNIANVVTGLLKRCHGTPNGTDILPPNRPTIPLPGGGLTADYVWVLEKPSVPPTVVASVAPDTVEEIIEAAWQRWMVIADLTNKLTVRKLPAGAPANHANLTISFASLDGTGNELAVTETQFVDGEASQFTIQVDVAEVWTTSKLLATMTHEIGHALGLEHVDDTTAIMSAVLDPNLAGAQPNNVVLQAADKSALKDQGTWV